MSNKFKFNIKKFVAIIFIILCLIIVTFLVKAYCEGKFNSVETLQEYISSFGLLGFFILTIIQTVRVLFPILPGFLGYIVGGIMFGWLGGFICNYIGTSIGAIIAFLLSRKYGQSFVYKIFSGDRYRKITNWAANSKSYTFILILGMLLPLFPDDFLFYFTGLTEMKTRKFIILIILGKPWCILAYSLVFGLALF